MMPLGAAVMLTFLEWEICFTFQSSSLFLWVCMQAKRYRLERSLGHVTIRPGKLDFHHPYRHPTANDFFVFILYLSMEESS